MGHSVRFQYKDYLSRCRYDHFKDKTVVRPFYLYKGVSCAMCQFVCLRVRTHISFGQKSRRHTISCSQGLTIWSLSPVSWREIAYIIRVFQLWRGSCHSHLPHRRDRYRREQLYSGRPVWCQNSKPVQSTYNQFCDCQPFILPDSCNLYVTAKSLIINLPSILNLSFVPFRKHMKYQRKYT